MGTCVSMNLYSLKCLLSDIMAKIILNGNVFLALFFQSWLMRFQPLNSSKENSAMRNRFSRIKISSRARSRIPDFSLISSYPAKRVSVLRIVLTFDYSFSIILRKSDETDLSKDETTKVVLDVILHAKVYF